MYAFIRPNALRAANEAISTPTHTRLKNHVMFHIKREEEDDDNMEEDGDACFALPVLSSITVSCICSLYAVKINVAFHIYLWDKCEMLLELQAALLSLNPCMTKFSFT